VEVEMIKCSDPRSPLALVRQHHRKDDWPPDEWDGADFLHCFGSVEGALLYAALFVPELIEIEGCVFLKDLGTEGREATRHFEKVPGKLQLGRGSLPLLKSVRQWRWQHHAGCYDCGSMARSPAR
jgi:hypothetical protein